MEPKKTEDPIFKSPKNNGPNKSEQAITEMLNELIIAVAMGFVVYLKLSVKSWKHFVILVTFSVGLYYILCWVAYNCYHYLFIYHLDPKIFTLDRIHWLNRFSIYTQVWTMYAICFSAFAVILGVVTRYTRTKYEKLFQNADVITKLRNTPVLVKKKKLKHGRTLLEFDLKGVGLQKVKNKKDDLESLFDSPIESIEEGKRKSRVLITLSKEKLPEKLTYKEIYSSTSSKKFFPILT